MTLIHTSCTFATPALNAPPPHPWCSLHLLHTFGAPCTSSTPLVLPAPLIQERKEEPSQQMVESVTSDLTCSITSDLSQVHYTSELLTTLLFCYPDHPILTLSVLGYFEGWRIKHILEQEYIQRYQCLCSKKPNPRSIVQRQQPKYNNQGNAFRNPRSKPPPPSEAGAGYPNPRYQRHQDLHRLLQLPPHHPH